MTIRKTILVVSTIFIGVAVCLSVWFVLHKADSPSTHEHPTVSDSVSQSTSDNDPTPEHAPRRYKPLDKEDAEKAAQFIAAQIKSEYLESGTSNPESEKLIEIMESPAYAAFVERQFKNPANLLNTRAFYDFLESQGLLMDMGSSEVFRDTYPTGEPADYEPEMRLKTAQLFLTTEPVNPQDSQAARLQRAKVVAELVKTDDGGAWYLGQFGEDWGGAFGEQAGNPAFDWMTDVQQNAQRIVAAAGETTSVDTPQAQQETSSWDMSSVMESHSASDSGTEMPTPLDTSTDAEIAEIEAEIERSLRSQPSDITTPQRPDSPSDMEASLKAQFPSERFERAMDTLEQYGPEEGLRRLKENDPEVAKQVEQHRNREGVPR